ncbi:MAG: histone deacetylase [Anaerolineales bacterium]|nr:histone deacetylase [Anaerolineales bacterium]
MGLLENRGVLPRLVAAKATPISTERLTRNHSQRYIDTVRQVAERGGAHLDLDTYMSSRSYEAAMMAAGGLVNAVEAVLEGKVDNAFALVRPPGHHAEESRGMGFCLFNNVAVAARYALEEKGLERVLIVDFDVHHGNGTQDAFYDESCVLFFSTHQYPHYPGTGNWREIGRGAGEGYTANVPLPGGVGDEGFGLIFDEFLYPLAERYRPQLILVSAGYDSHWADPLAAMQLSITGYTHLARRLKAMADQLCQGRLVFTLEGGYELEVLAYAVLNTFHVLLGDEEIHDPLGPARRSERDVSDLLDQLKGLHRLV